MEYYGLRKAGADIDLVICDEDYQALALAYPDKRKDIWGDLGVVLEPFEIWRCIMLMDYDFYMRDAVDEKNAYVVSLDRLLLMRVFAMDVPKYREETDKRLLLQNFSQSRFCKNTRTAYCFVSTYRRYYMGRKIYRLRGYYYVRIIHAR